MSGEPELQEGHSDEWVRYLQQQMKRFGFWQGDEDGAFTPELTEAVSQLQYSAGISPADGVVRQSTWDALNDLAAGENHGYGNDPSQTPAPPASEDGSANPGAGVGVPSFTYTLPNITLAEATIDTGAATVHMQLTMGGTVQVTFQQSVQGYTLNVNDGAWKIAAQSTLGGIQEGIEVSGWESGSPQIASQWGNQFAQTSVSFQPPNTVAYQGQINVSYQVDTDMGPVQVQGQPSYQLTVTVTPHPTAPEPAPEPVDVPSWWEVHATELLVVAGTVLVVGAAIALAPETGGGSLVLAAAAL
jgi:hypothetical protein